MTDDKDHLIASWQSIADKFDTEVTSYAIGDPAVASDRVDANECPTYSEIIESRKANANTETYVNEQGQMMIIDKDLRYENNQLVKLKDIQLSTGIYVKSSPGKVRVGVYTKDKHLPIIFEESNTTEGAIVPIENNFKIIPDIVYIRLGDKVSAQKLSYISEISIHTLDGRDLPTKTPYKYNLADLSGKSDDGNHPIVGPFYSILLPEGIKGSDISYISLTLKSYSDISLIRGVSVIPDLPNNVEISEVDCIVPISNRYSGFTMFPFDRSIQGPIKSIKFSGIPSDKKLELVGETSSSKDSYVMKSGDNTTYEFKLGSNRTYDADQEYVLTGKLVNLDGYQGSVVRIISPAPARGEITLNPAPIGVPSNGFITPGNYSYSGEKLSESEATFIIRNNESTPIVIDTSGTIDGGGHKSMLAPGKSIRGKYSVTTTANFYVYKAVKYLFINGMNEPITLNLSALNGSIRATPDGGADSNNIRLEIGGKKTLWIIPTRTDKPQCSLDIYCNEYMGKSEFGYELRSPDTDYVRVDRSNQSNGSITLDFDFRNGPIDSGIIITDRIGLH